MKLGWLERKTKDLLETLKRESGKNLSSMWKVQILRMILMEQSTVMRLMRSLKRKRKGRKQSLVKLLLRSQIRPKQQRIPQQVLREVIIHQVRW